MTFFYVFKDGAIQARCGTRDNAIALIKDFQEIEKKAHQFLRAEFTIIEGKEEETIKY